MALLDQGSGSAPTPPLPTPEQIAAAQAAYQSGAGVAPGPGLFNAAKAAGQTVQNVFGAGVQAPVIGGALQAAGTPLSIGTIPFNLIGALATPQGRQAALQNYQTLQGGQPGLFDVPAVARALQAGSGATAGAFGQIAENENIPLGLRGVAAGAQFATGALPNLAKVPFLPPIGRGIQAGAESAGSEIASQAARIPPVETGGFLRGEAGAARVPGGETPQFSVKVVRPGTWAVEDPAGNTVKEFSDPNSFAAAQAAAKAEAARLNAGAAPLTAQAKAFGVTPEAQAIAALNNIPASIKSQVRKLARDEPHTLTEPQLLDAIDTALTKVKAPINADTRNATLAALARDAGERNAGGAALNAARNTARQLVAKPTTPSGPLGQRIAQNPIAAKIGAGDLTKLPERAAQDTIDAANGIRPSTDMSTYNTVPGGEDLAAARQALAERMGVDPVTGLAPGETGAIVGEGTKTGQLPPGPPNIGGRLVRGAEGLARTSKGFETALSPFHYMGRHALPVVGFPKAYIKGPGGTLRAIKMTPAEMTADAVRMRDELAAKGHPGVVIQRQHLGAVGGAEDTASFVRSNPLINTLLTPFQKSGQGFVGGLNTVRFSLANEIDKFTQFMVDKGWVKSLTKEDRAGIDRAINVFTGVGIDTKNLSPGAANLLRIANTIGPFSPQLTVARVKMLGYGTKGMSDVLNDLVHHRPINADALVRARLGMGALVGMGGLYALQQIALGGKTNTNPLQTDFAQTNLGQPSDRNRLIAGAAVQLGVGESSYPGKDVLLNPTASEAALIRTMARLAVSIYDAATHQKTLQRATGASSEKDFFEVAKDELVSQLFTSPFSYPIAQFLQGYSIEPLAPITPIEVSAALTAGGTQLPTVGGGSAVDAERKRLGGTVPSAPGMANLSITDQIGYSNGLKQATDAAGTALMATPKYQQATDAQRQDLLTKAIDTASQHFSRAFGIQAAIKATDPTEAAGALEVALGASPRNIDKAVALQEVASSGKLTPALKQAIDSQRENTDPNKAGYELSVDDYIKGGSLQQKWLTAPAFLDGKPTDWAAAYRALNQYRALLPANPTAEKVHADANLEKFYLTAANGYLQEFFSITGAAKSALISPERKAIQADPLFSRFAPTLDDILSHLGQ